MRSLPMPARCIFHGWRRRFRILLIERPTTTPPQNSSPTLRNLGPPMNRSAVIPLLSAMMFLQFFVCGSWYVTVGNYMNAHGMADIIGCAYSVGPIAAIISPLFLGMIADRYFASERVLGA